MSIRNLCICFICSVIFTLISTKALAQQCPGTDITENINFRLSGAIDFTIIGATINPFENNDVASNGCETLLPRVTTSASLNIPVADTIKQAILYWSTTGPTDNQVALNGQSVTAQQTWTTSGANQTYFSARADVSAQVIATGNGVYTISDFDRTSFYQQFNCQTTSLMYGGWALVVVYQNEDVYDKFTVFTYDGFTNFQNCNLSVNLNTNVFDKFEGSHVGVVAWEGDGDAAQSGADNITLNGQILPSGGYTDVNNIFNGTNSFANPVDNNFFNADLDDFDASNVVQQQLNTANANFNFFIQSGQDLVILNTLVFRIPNEAPDARLELPADLNFGCGETREFTFDYTYLNDDEATNILEAGTPIGFYLNSTTGPLIGQDVTDIELRPGQQDNNTVTVTIPADALGDLVIVGVIDDPGITGTQNGSVLETFETNNTFTTTGFVDQHYRDFIITENRCVGETYTLPDGSNVSADTDFTFNELTVRGGCDSIGTLQVRFGPSYNLVDNPVICEGESFTLPDGESVERDPSSTPYSFETRLLTVVGCDSIITTNLTVNAHGRFLDEPVLCIGDSYTLPDLTTITENGEYETILPGAASNGCDSIVTTVINLIDIEYPTAFTPNGNNMNDGFSALFPDFCALRPNAYHLRVFSRWGELVFESQDFAEKWQGAYNGPAGASLYLWHVRYSFENGTSVEREGGVTLIR